MFSWNNNKHVNILRLENHFNILWLKWRWAATSEIVPSNMCAQQRLKSACAIVQPDQSFSCLNEKTFASLTIQNAPMEDSDQNARMRRLFLKFFAGRICPQVHFLTLWVIYLQKMFDSSATHASWRTEGPELIYVFVCYLYFPQSFSAFYGCIPRIYYIIMWFVNEVVEYFTKAC